jgi:hypothetical protein
LGHIVIVIKTYEFGERTYVLQKPVLMIFAIGVCPHIEFESLEQAREFIAENWLENSADEWCTLHVAQFVEGEWHQVERTEFVPSGMVLA